MVITFSLECVYGWAVSVAALQRASGSSFPPWWGTVASCPQYLICIPERKYNFICSLILLRYLIQSSDSILIRLSYSFHHCFISAPFLYAGGVLGWGHGMRVWLAGQCECVWAGCRLSWSRCFVLRSSWIRSLIVVARCVSSGRTVWRACIHRRGFDPQWEMSDSSTRPVSCMRPVIFLSPPQSTPHWLTPLLPTVSSPTSHRDHPCMGVAQQKYSSIL